MPTLELNDMELATAAMALRGMKRLALEDAARQQNPGIRAIFERSAKVHEELIQRFERARNAGKPTG